MSLILDALNRADQERKEQDHIPSLQTVHGGGERAKPSLRQRLRPERWLVVLVVAYLAYDYLQERVIGVQHETPAKREAVNVTPNPAPVAEPQDRTSLEQAMPAEEVVQPAVRESSAAKLAEPENAVLGNSAIASLYQQPRASEDKNPTESAAPPSADLTAGIDESQSQQSLTSDRDQAFKLVLEVTDLDKEFRRQIPTLKYGNHQPAANPQDSRVLLNDIVYKEGDPVAPGLVLRQISQEGIVLEFQGTQFKLPAYNSWINFPGS